MPARDMWKAVRVRPIEEGVKGHQRLRRRLEAIQAVRAMQPAVKGYPATYGSSIGGYSATLKVSILDRQLQRLRLSPARSDSPSTIGAARRGCKEGATGNLKATWRTFTSQPMSSCEVSVQSVDPLYDRDIASLKLAYPASAYVPFVMASVLSVSIAETAHVHTKRARTAARCCHNPRRTASPWPRVHASLLPLRSRACTQSTNNVQE
jgi:hypothetical protein